MTNQLNIAIVGAGGFTGNYAIDACASERIVALCDVDRNALSTQQEKHPEAKTFLDYREMFDELGERIDAVTISTPDHTHYAIAMAAIERGKHVFVQKPMARTIGEVRALREAARTHGVITQMGNQGHTMEGIRVVKEWVQAGILGEVTEIHAWTDRPRMPWFEKPETVPPPADNAPENLDWDLWLGPAETRPYSEAYSDKRWRAWWDFGCGALGDMGCHILDGPFWALDLGMPTRIEVRTNDPVREEHTAFGAIVRYHFPARGEAPPVTLTWYEGDNEILLPPDFEEDREIASNGFYMMGDKATVMAFGPQANNPAIVPQTRMDELKASLPAPTIPRVEGGPVEEWLRAIHGAGPMPGANFEYAAPLTEVVLLGALAIRTGQTIEWDAAAMQVTNHPEFDRFLQIPQDCR
ncbi:MAG: Gfo/Idh/MocA family oxidoreductase [Victivallales bacterium]|nr:Gfo/Idh/MocA family oxidoreductase [Victivallales bacterium]